MNKKYIRFSLVLGGLCLAFWSDAGAVPSIKRLGGANAYIGTSGAVSAKSGNYDKKTNNDARSASIRTNRISGRTGTTTNRPSAKANTARLSVGKYLHQSGTDKNIIKKVSTSSQSSGIDAAELESLTNRVTNLETQITTKVDTSTLINNYYTKTDVEDDYATKTYVNDVVSGGAGIVTVNDWDPSILTNP